MKSDEEISKLIRLKRYEKPPEGYVEEFVIEFHSRQRAELLKGSAHSLFFERVQTYFSGFSQPTLIGAAAACVVAVTTVVVVSMNGEEGTEQPIASNPTAIDLEATTTNPSTADPLPLPTEIDPSLPAHPSQGGIQRVSDEGRPILIEK